MVYFLFIVLLCFLCERIMGRSRSRSRSREKRRSRSPERWSKRSRSRSPTEKRGKDKRKRSSRRRGSHEDDDAWKREVDRREEARQRWSVSPERKKGTNEDEAAAPTAIYEPGSMEAQMIAMGLPVDFSSTKGKHVEGNDDFVVADVPQLRKHRQYMNKKITKSEKERIRVPIRR
jgi:U4/U6.U5 tri-snRNP-associated protein 3